MRQIPVVVLTTSKADEDILRSYDSGASSFISKPVTFEGLVDVMKGLGRYWFEIVDLPRQDSAREMKSETIKVLLIDDDEDDYILTRELFSLVKDGKYELDWASSYEEGLQVAGRREHHVCLVDYRLGERSGVQLIREARESRLTTPMILLTGQGDHDVDVEAMEAGATDYLVKDETSPARLERTIRYAVKLNTERCRAEAELEQRVADRTAQLQATNKELEAFSYSVSHDLRAPLRHMNGFSQALLEDYGDKLDEDGKAYLQEVRNASREMAQLIDDMLQLARVTRSEMQRDVVDLTELAHEIIAELLQQEILRDET